MLESEAKTKGCPFSFNHLFGWSRCAGSKCMAWVPIGPAPKTMPEGYCGMVPPTHIDVDNHH